MLTTIALIALTVVALILIWQQRPDR